MDQPFKRVKVGHSGNIYSELRDLQKSELLTDVTLRCGQTEVRAHKCVLAASSEYFRACLTSSMSESRSNSVVILTLTKEDCLQDIINHVYGDDIDICETNVMDILDAANQLAIDDLKEKCCIFLGASISVESCLNLCSLADTYNCIELGKLAKDFICKNFEQVCSTHEWNCLSRDQIVDFVSSDALCLRREIVSFQAINNWVSADEDTRADYFPSLMKHVRMELISPDEIATVLHTNKYMQLYKDTILLSAYKYHALHDTNTPQPRGPFQRRDALHDVVFVVGGDDGIDDHTAYTSVMVYDTVVREWTKYPPLLQGRSVASSVYIPSSLKVLVVGGYDGHRASPSTFQYDFNTAKWSELAPLKRRRCSCASVVLGGEVYAIGGVCGPATLVSVEVYNPFRNTWGDTTPLQTCRSACGAVVIDIGGVSHIFVCGGITTEGHTIATTEIYSSTDKTWRFMASMKSPRRSFSLCVWNGKVFAIGGNDGNTNISSAEIYDPASNTWKYVAPLNDARMFSGAAVLSDGVMVVGGFGDEIGTLATVEKYTCLNEGSSESAQKGKWEYLRPDLDAPMCGCAVVTVPDVPLSILLQQEVHTNPVKPSGCEEKVAV